MKFMGVEVVLYTESPYCDDYMTFLVNFHGDIQGYPQACVAEYGPNNDVMVHVNRVFMKQPLETQLAVLCHEVGHYRNGHLKGPHRNELSRGEQTCREIEADYFAAECGFGDELIAMMRNYNDEASKIRVQALEQWNELNRLDDARQNRETIRQEALQRRGEAVDAG